MINKLIQRLRSKHPIEPGSKVYYFTSNCELIEYTVISYTKTLSSVTGEPHYSYYLQSVFLDEDGIPETRRIYNACEPNTIFRTMNAFYKYLDKYPYSKICYVDALRERNQVDIRVGMRVSNLAKEILYGQ